MLLRQDERGVLAIGQPSHAWLSGQLARAWGNQRFGGVEPLEEVCLAAEQHDAGWRTLDLEPSYNPETGLPRSFMEMPLDVHLRLWTEGPRSLASQSRYVALLVSLHGWRLYQRRNLGRLAPDDAAAITRFLEGQRSFQQELVAWLRSDPDAAWLAEDEERIERNSLLIWTWDYLSLALCLNWNSATAERAPTGDGLTDVLVKIGDAGVSHLDPWPFSVDSLAVHVEGRRLNRRFADEHEMREAFAQAPWETVEVRLEPWPG